jgi:hypothetical protein
MNLPVLTETEIKKQPLLVKLIAIPGIERLADYSGPRATAAHWEDDIYFRRNDGSCFRYTWEWDGTCMTESTWPRTHADVEEVIRWHALSEEERELELAD